MKSSAQPALIIVGLALAVPAMASDSKPVQAQAASGPQVMVVSKTETCGCCGDWVEHAKQAGYQVEVRNMTQAALTQLKNQLAIPSAARSCHTTQVGGYYVEGHVPLSDVDRLLQERPEAAGLAVPGMPLGSPGMEYGEEKDPYDTYLVSKDGRGQVFQSHNAQ